MVKRLNAIDVVDWDYLKRLAQPHDLAWSTDPKRVLEIFAFQLTSAEDTESQNDVLAALLLRITSGHSKETNLGVIIYLADKFCTHPQLLCEFAKQVGVLL